MAMPFRWIKARKHVVLNTQQSPIVKQSTSGAQKYHAFLVRQ